MGLNFRWLVNAGLLILPVGTTVGVLMGVDSHRQTTGQEPLFNTPSSGPGTGGGTGNPSDDRITTEVHCEKQTGRIAPTRGVQYILNPNQWGILEDTVGAMCMHMSLNNNGSYPTPSSAPPFFVTWSYAPGPDTQPVHAFPNVQVVTGLPMLLSKVKSINLATEWTYGVGDTPALKTDIAALTANAVNTNVAVDMFFDADKNKAKNSSQAAFEVMVWFADIGPAAQVIGLPAGTIATQVINTTTFELYSGINGFKQNVLTWKARNMTETFYGDIAPLITQLNTIPAAKFDGTNLYLGHVGMGTEAFSATQNVTFSMPVLSVDIGV
ncbi:related to endoglucanase I precursor [Rhynchosporium graminicola]|uniref:Related to endoglucanase I n=1 Tax=Rhynchosporium graminicola TaxID=2792576 RepID=A0A1E1LBQ3_9HELO|nr:related to endoglucanase I precursor [Rhynchosporium commune]